jgi:DNA-binding transcriptional ArsR family regulator
LLAGARADIIAVAWTDRSAGRAGLRKPGSRFRLASERAGRSEGARLAFFLLGGADLMTESGISIGLTRAQVDQVVREASEEVGVSSLLRGMNDRGALASKYRALSESPRLSRSLLLGLLVLACFPTDGDSLAVSDIAERLGMSPSTTHRYMTTLLAVGLLEQEPRTRRYRVPVKA